MCGIVAYIGPQEAAPILLEGLKRLEYRGYDSAGIAVIANGRLEIRREVGKLSNLLSKVQAAPVQGHLGIGHTRWATHGEPSERNAHPHTSASGEVVVVHNGIVENFLELKDELQAEGVEFKSDTDTEVIAHLVDRYLHAGYPLAEATRRAIHNLRGAHGIVVMSLREPDRIVAARVGNAGGVVVGKGEGEMFIASDMPALLEHTRLMGFLDPGQMVVVTSEGFTVSDLEGHPVDLPLQLVSWDPVAAEKGNYKHFMQKEIQEQVRSIGDTIAGRVEFGEAEICLPDLHLSSEVAALAQSCPDWLWHGLSRGHGRTPAPGASGPNSGRGRDRLRVSLWGPRAGRRHPRDRHQPIRRNGRYPGRHGRSQAQRMHLMEHCQRGGLPGHAFGGWVPDHAKRPGDRGGFDQGVHRPPG